MDGERTLTQGMVDAKMRPGGRIVWNRDATLNDSDKSYTVPAGKIWEVKLIVLELATTATVGNRKAQVDYTNGTNVIWRSNSPGNTPASATQQMYLSTDVVPNLSATTARYKLASQAVADQALVDALPHVYLPAGYVVRVWESNAIDAAADDLTVIIHYIEYDNV